MRTLNRGPRQRRRAYAAVAVLSLGLSLTACGGDTSAGAEVSTLNVGATTSLSGVGIRHTISSGIFTESGLAVTAAAVKSGNDAIPQLVSGELQIALIDTTTAMQAIAKGLPIKIIAAAGVQSTNGGDREPSVGSVLVLPNSDIETPADLVGRNLGVPAINNQIWMNIRINVDASGGDSSKVNFIEVPGAQAIDLLVKGDIDATTASEPLASASVAAGKVRLVHSTDIPGGKGQPSSVYVATNEFISKNPGTLKKFTEGIYKGQGQVNENKELGNKVAVEQLNYKAEQLTNAYTIDYGTDAIKPADLDAVAKNAVKYGILTDVPDTANLLATTK